MAIALSILIVGSIVFYAACLWFTRQFFIVPSSIEDLSTEGVSILVPVCRLDEGAWVNWAAFCKQNYDTYEVLFRVIESTDPAVPMLKKLVDLLPDRAQLLDGLQPRGINYKDSTLSYLLKTAHYEVIIFADSDIRVSSDYIQTVTESLADPMWDSSPVRLWGSSSESSDPDPNADKRESETCSEATVLESQIEFVEQDDRPSDPTTQSCNRWHRPTHPNAKYQNWDNSQNTLTPKDHRRSPLF